MDLNPTKVSKPGYSGDWYKLPDGKEFGIRNSVKNGKTLDLDQLGIKGVEKIHYK